MKTTAGLKKPLTGKETTALMDYVCGQNSDEYGEGLEQRPIKTLDGEIYVSQLLEPRNAKGTSKSK